jgi:hypothetical protein
MSVSTLGVYKKAIVRFGSLNTHAPPSSSLKTSYCVCMFPVFSRLCVSPVTCELRKEKKNCVCVCVCTDTHNKARNQGIKNISWKELSSGYTTKNLFPDIWSCRLLYWGGRVV